MLELSFETDSFDILFQTNPCFSLCDLKTFCHILPRAENAAFLLSRNIEAKEWRAYLDLECG